MTVWADQSMARRMMRPRCLATCQLIPAPSAASAEDTASAASRTAHRARAAVVVAVHFDNPDSPADRLGQVAVGADSRVYQAVVVAAAAAGNIAADSCS